MLVREYQNYLDRRRRLSPHYCNEWSYIRGIETELYKSKKEARSHARDSARAAEYNAADYARRGRTPGMVNNVVTRWHYKQLGTILDI